MGHSSSCKVQLSPAPAWWRGGLGSHSPVRKGGSWLEKLQLVPVSPVPAVAALAQFHVSATKAFSECDTLCPTSQQNRARLESSNPTSPCPWQRFQRTQVPSCISKKHFIYNIIHVDPQVSGFPCLSPSEQQQNSSLEKRVKSRGCAMESEDSAQSWSRAQSSTCPVAKSRSVACHAKFEPCWWRGKERDSTSGQAKDSAHSTGVSEG